MVTSHNASVFLPADRDRRLLNDGRSGIPAETGRPVDALRGRPCGTTGTSRSRPEEGAGTSKDNLMEVAMSPSVGFT